ncbi:Plasma membrane proteolipid 3 like protein [Verticillium longisporum]|nr:Plasma membrane proteolipid 3 like protein [Verticillium longisporum]
MPFTASDICKILLAIILPPVGVFLERGCGADLLINILLTILGYIPGIIHALYIILNENATHSSKSHPNYPDPATPETTQPHHSSRINRRSSTAAFFSHRNGLSLSLYLSVSLTFSFATDASGDARTGESAVYQSSLT